MVQMNLVLMSLCEPPPNTNPNITAVYTSRLVMSSDSDVINKDNVRWLFLQLRKVIQKPLSLGADLKINKYDLEHITHAVQMGVDRIDVYLIRVLLIAVANSCPLSTLWEVLPDRAGSMPTRQMAEAIKTWNPNMSKISTPERSWSVYDRKASSYWFMAGFLMGLDQNALDNIFLTSHGALPYYVTMASAAENAPHGAMRQFHMDLLNQFLADVHVKLVK